MLMTQLWRMFPLDDGVEPARTTRKWSIPFPWRPLHEPGRIEDWPEMVLTVQRGAELRDCHPCIKGFEVYSQKLRRAIESALLPVDEVQWLPVTLIHGDHSQPRWVCNPLFGPEAIDQERTKRIDTTDAPFPMQSITSAVYDLAKIGGHQIFKYPYGSIPVVTDRVKGAIEKAGCTGIQFEPTPSVDRRA